MITLPKGYTLEIQDEWANDPNKQDPAWYVEYGGGYLIATVESDDGEIANIYCVGEMRYEWGEFSLRSTSAILKETPFTTDADLERAIEAGEISVENNAWFEVELPSGEWEIVDTIEAGVLYAVEEMDK